MNYLENTKKAKVFLSTLNSQIDLAYYMTDEITNYDELTEAIENENGFDIEIIYYHNAIEYLKENDCSLKYSFEIADEYGYELKNLNSETLASLLASKLEREKYYNLENEISSFFNDLEHENTN
jgi:hypothetical protein